MDRLGRDGDGIAIGPAGERVVVRGVLPGERVAASGHAGQAFALETLIEASPDRVAPPCRHFPTCGGCTLQHLRPDAALAHKVAVVAGQLAEAGFGDVALLPPQASPPRSRRRMDLAYARAEGNCVIGLHARGSDAIVDLHECHILEPALFALLAPLRQTLARLALTGRAGSIVVNGLDDGADLLLRSTTAPSTADRAALAGLAAAHSVRRITWQHEDPRRRTAPEPLATLGAPTLRLGRGNVTVPPGAFLQPTRAGEAAIVADVCAGLADLGRQARVVELYAGVGTLTFPIAAQAKVRAIEGDEAAIAALARAAGGMRIETVRRDLARAPLAVAELTGADAVVLDPPFGGAGAQMQTVAAAGVPVVIVVSCNPAALRREAALLREAGYALSRARVIDQFPFSAHVESVAVFRRESSRRSRSGRARSGS